MKFKIFYGWWIVAAGLFLTFYNSAFFGYGWTAFLNPILTTFGWTMAQLSLGSSLRSAESGIFNPIWGIVVDRFSPRKLMIIGVLITSVGIILIYRTTNLPMFYISFLIAGIGSSLTGLVPTVLISRWFKRDFGKANGVLALGMGLGGIVLPLVVRMIDTWEWQTTLLICAIGWTAIGIPLAFICRNPSPVIGSNGEPGTKTTKFPTTGLGVNVKTALKTRAFWHINISTFCSYFVTGVPMLFLMPYFTTMGISRTTSSVTITLYTLVSLFGRLLFGWLADKYKSSYLIAITTGLTGIGTFIFSFITKESSFSLIVLFAIIYGLGLSGVIPLRPPILREYFGTKNFGTIYGVSSISNTISGLLSPIITGIIVTKYGNYGPIWLGLSGIAILGVIIILTVPRPSTKTTEAV